MLSTRNFVFIAFPKTGSTFVRNVMETSHQRLRRRHAWMLSSLFRQDLYEVRLAAQFDGTGLTQHGFRSQIPLRWNAKQAVSILRPPGARFESTYRFQHWCRRRTVDSNFLERYPAFPILTPEEFWDMQKRRWHGFFPSLAELGLGYQSVQLVVFFSSRELWNQVLAGRFKMKEELFEAFVQDTEAVTFLRQQHLSKDLVALFQNLPMESKVKEAVNMVKSSNVTKELEKFYEPLPITPELRVEVEHDERFMIEFMQHRMLLDC